MSDALRRLEILMGDTLQILDHMKVNSVHNDILRTIKHSIKEQNNKVEALSKHTGEQRIQSAVSMTKQLHAINTKVQQLETQLMEEYKQATGNQIESYEQMAFEEQVEQKETYHNKIDYLSATKIQENINRMNEVLYSIISSS
ncbi:hypothetical protein OEV98_03665 [Caldibacillus lycopersici]|uniref:Uncharacterized protein n=1 Tax=Perspicuibacillus lycopersici TaxID=1325689 RepID=A0AAE3IR48_9BACI|nr:hypothetical protein [Perspicuibacillus lycopersici]MCU9612662.1 hypothetical protein [Perspicuibacillus lycopersici]